MVPGTLYILSGLPGVGKSTLGKLLAQHTGALYLRIDTVEHALLDLCAFKAEGEGYQLSYRLAQDNLALGVSVIADSCNPVELTRVAWRQVAENCGADFIDIEIGCSDTEEHRLRVEDRWKAGDRDRLPTWSDVRNREYLSRDYPVVQIDTSGRSVEQSFRLLVEALSVRVTV